MTAAFELSRDRAPRRSLDVGLRQQAPRSARASNQPLHFMSV